MSADARAAPLWIRADRTARRAGPAMTAVDTADARGAGFIAAIAETARRCRPAPQVCEQPDGLELLPSDEGGFAVRVHVTEGEVRIALGPWSHVIARDAELDLALLDLTNAGPASPASFPSRPSCRALAELCARTARAASTT